MSQTACQRLHAPVQVRAVDPKNLTVDIVASTPSVDSYGTVIDQNGWDLEQFKRNPVITWAHDDRGFTASNGLPVANAIPETVRVEGGLLKMRLRFTPQDVHPFGYQVFRMISEGFLHGVSVGFDPKESTVTEDADGKAVPVYKKCKLLETAVVTIPSNDDALVQRARQLNREDELPSFRRMAQQVEELAKAEAVKSDEGKPAEEVKAVDPAAEQPNPEEKADRAIGDVIVSVRASDVGAFESLKAEVAKWRGYFENKQPANRASTKVLARFYKTRGIDAPADEVEAWERMGELLDGPAVTDTAAADVPVAAETPAAEVSGTSETTVDVVAQETPAEPVAAETPAAEEPAAAPAAEEAKPEQAPEAKEEPTPPKSTESAPAEAPQDARKASVQVPLSALPMLKRSIVEACVEAAVKASRQGLPLSGSDDVIEAAGLAFARALTRS